jgi:hypothetical protein
LGTVKCWVDDNYGGAKELHGTAEVEEVIATCVRNAKVVWQGADIGQAVHDRQRGVEGFALRKYMNLSAVH